MSIRFKAENLRYTYLRKGIYYVQIPLTNGKLYRKSLLTDSLRKASDLMAIIRPQIMLVKRSRVSIDSLNTLDWLLDHSSDWRMGD